MSELIPFLVAVGAFAGVGVVAGILIARRIDSWETTHGEPPDEAEDRDP